MDVNYIFFLEINVKNFFVQTELNWNMTLQFRGMPLNFIYQERQDLKTVVKTSSNNLTNNNYYKNK